MSNGCARVCGAARKNVASLEKHKRQRQKPLPFMLVEATGFAPWADAHGKQRVTAVLSSVEASDPQPLVACVSPPLGNTWRLGHRSGGTYALAHLVAARTAGDRCAMNCLTRPTIPHASLEKHKRQRQKPLPFMLVEATGFEPTTSWSRTKRATICATPRTRLL